MEFLIKINEGETFILPLAYKDGDGGIIPLVDYKAKMQIRETLSSSTSILELSTENGCITINGPLGEIEIVASDETTATLNFPFRGIYDLFIISPDPDDQTEKIMHGPVEGVQSATRPV